MRADTATAKDRGIAPDGVFAELRPSRDEVFTAVARHYVCNQRRDAAADLHDFDPRPIPSHMFSPKHTKKSWARALEAQRNLFADLLEAGYPHRADLPALAKALAALRTRRLPSPLSAGAPWMLVTDWEAALARYDAWIDSPQQ